MTKLLLALTSTLLLASVGLNIYLIKKQVEQIESQEPVTSIPKPLAPIDIDKPTQSENYVSARRYFEQGEFAQAITAFEQLTNHSNIGEAQALKAFWVEQANTWLDQSEIATLKVFEQLFLKRFPNDFDFLLIEADRLTKTESLLDGAIAYYQLQSRPLSEEQHNKVSERISETTLPNLEKLMQSEAWDIVERFAEPLLQFEPDNERFLLILAEAYAQRQEPSLMEQTFSRVTYRDDLDKEFKRIRSLVRYDSPRQSKQGQQNKNVSRGIALLQTGNHYIVRAFLDNSSELDLLIDTGASTTAITHQRFRRLYKKHRPELIGRFPINTANGQVNAPIFRFSSLTIDDFQVNNFAVIVLPDRSNLESDGLLGMNFLRHYDFRIDQRSSELFLQRR
jgi:clan AA aspartic protease (TIGR02281 family)